MKTLKDKKAGTLTVCWKLNWNFRWPKLVRRKKTKDSTPVSFATGFGMYCSKHKYFTLICMGEWGWWLCLGSVLTVATLFKTYVYPHEIHFLVSERFSSPLKLSA